MALSELEKYEEAVKSFNEVLKHDPNNTDALYFKGDALNSLEDNEGALDCIEKLLKIEPNDENAWNLKGIIFMELGKPESNKML